MKLSHTELKKKRNELALLSMQLEDKFYETLDREDWLNLTEVDDEYWYLNDLLGEDTERPLRWYDNFFNI